MTWLQSISLSLQETIFDVAPILIILLVFQVLVLRRRPPHLKRIVLGFLYVLIATIGMKMDIMAVFENPGLFLVGGIWIGFHAVTLLVVARLIRAPVFYLAVGSQANVGGAASAPVVASAFHPSLAPVGVLLAVLGYAIGTYAAWVCGQIMRVVAPA